MYLIKSKLLRLQLFYSIIANLFSVPGLIERVEAGDENLPSAFSSTTPKEVFRLSHTPFRVDTSVEMEYSSPVLNDRTNSIQGRSFPAGAAILESNWNSQEHDRVNINSESRDLVQPNEVHLEGVPFFVQHPKPLYYTMQNRPAIVECVAEPVSHAIIACAEQISPYKGPNGSGRLKVTRLNGINQPDQSGRRWHLALEVPAREVEEWFDSYICHCEAWNHVLELNRPKKVKSKEAVIVEAYLAREFQVEPVSTDLNVGDQLVLTCIPPKGRPEPDAYWMKDGTRIQSNTTSEILINDYNQLIIENITSNDSGNYTCVAECLGLEFRYSTATVTILPEQPYNDVRKPHHQPTTKHRVILTLILYGGLLLLLIAILTIFVYIMIWCNKYRRNSSTSRFLHRWISDSIITANQEKGRSSILNRVHVRTDEAISNALEDDQITANPIAHDLENGKLLCNSTAGNMEFSNCTQKKRPRFHTSIPPEAGPIVPTHQDSEKSRELLITDFPVYSESEPQQLRRGQITGQLPSSPRWLHPAYTTSERANERWTESSCGPSPVNTTVSILRSGYGSGVGNDFGIGKTGYNPMSNPTITTSNISQYEYCSQQELNMYYELERGNTTSDDDIQTVKQYVTNEGGILCIGEAGIAIGIAPTSFPSSDGQEVHAGVCRKASQGPILPANHIRLSPIIQLGPETLKLSRPALLTFRCCTDLKMINLRVWLMRADFIPDFNIDSTRTNAHHPTGTWRSNWKTVPLSPNICTSTQRLGSTYLLNPITTELNINGPLRFCFIGEFNQSSNDLHTYIPYCPGKSRNTAYKANSARLLHLVAFGGCLSRYSDYQVRVYVLTDLATTLTQVGCVETQLKGRQIGRVKQFSFYDNHSSLVFHIHNVSTGWRCRLANARQEIPYRHIGDGTKLLHCAFSLEHVDYTNSSISFDINIFQKGWEQRCVFINAPLMDTQSHGL